MGHVKKESSHRNIYVMDRGLQSIRTMKAFGSNAITFICRAKENKKFVELESFVKEDQDLDLGESILLKDCEVQLYAGVPINNKESNRHFRHGLVDSHFRLVIAESKLDGKKYWFLTNDFDLYAKEVAQVYRRRWDIEVLFRFGRAHV